MGAARVSLDHDDSSYSDTCTHIFHSGTPNCVKQGVPDACFKIPSENPVD